jgi:hypothetical protein
MILVRFVFQAEFGKAGEVIEAFKQNAESTGGFVEADVRVRYLTDLSGPFDTVVQEIEVESLAQWEKLREELFSNPEFQEAQQTMEIPFTSGRAEFYTIEGTYGG